MADAGQIASDQMTDTPAAAALPARRPTRSVAGPIQETRPLASPDAQLIWTLAPDGRADDLPAWRAYTGLSGAAVAGWGWLDAIHEDDRERVREMWAGALATEQPATLDCRVRRHDGEYRWFVLRLEPMCAATGELREWVVVGTDVTAWQQHDNARLYEEAQEAIAARDQALAAVEAERARLETVLQQLPVGVIIAEAPTGRLLLGNEQVTRIWGHPLFAADDVSGYAQYQGFHADGRPYASAEWPLARVLVTGEIITGEEIGFQRGDGTHGTMVVNAAPVRDAAGTVVAGVVAFSDITARKQAEERLALLAEIGKLATDALDMRQCLAAIAHALTPRLADYCVICLFDDVGEYQPQAAVHADPAEAAILDELARLYRPDLQNERSPIARALRHGEIVWAETVTSASQDTGVRDREVLRLYRQLNPVSYAAVPLLARGRAIGVIICGYSCSGRHYAAADVSLLQEIASRCALSLDNARLYQEAQAALAQAEAERDRLQQMLDLLPVAVVIVSRDGHYTASNRAAAALLGRNLAGTPAPLESAESFGARHLDGTPYPVRELPIARSLRAGEVILGEQLFCHNAVTGRDVPILVNSAPLRDATGTITSAMVVFQDITALKELELAREEFISSTTHDLKTPLTAILGLAQLLKQQLARTSTPENSRYVEWLGQIITVAKRMAAQLNQLQDTVLLAVGQRLALEWTETDLVALVRQVVQEAQATSRQHRLRVETTVPQLRGVVDPNRLVRVLNNLLSNAIKYSPAGGDVTITIARVEQPDGPEAVLTVRDHGLGIPAADLPHIFERYRRAGNAAGIAPGSGIGLASVRQIVEQHGGRIALESEEGQGTTVTLWLPLAGRPDE